MGFRFRKTIGRGNIKTTLGKSSVSVGAGVGNARVSHSTSGRNRATFSFPGTGVSYVAQKGGKSGGAGTVVTVLVVALILIFSSCGHDSEPAAVDVTPIQTPDPLAPVDKETEEETSRSLSVEEAHIPSENTAESEPAPEITLEPTSEPTPEPTPMQFTYVINTSTHKFHRPGCSSVKDIKPSNYKEYTGTIEELEAMGYTACQRCGK